MKERWKAKVEAVRSSRWLTLPVFLGFAASFLLVLFARLGGEIIEGETLGFDGCVLNLALALRAAWPLVSVVMRDLSGVGSTVALTLITAGACGYLAVRARWRAAGLMGASVLSGAGAVQLLKTGLGRARPAAVFAEYVATGPGFPSGHTSMSAVVFLTLGMLAARAHRRVGERVFIVAFSLLMVVLVGISRAALGVHWATDVVGGWAFGIGWATAWLLVARHVDSKTSR